MFKKGFKFIVIQILTLEARFVLYRYRPSIIAVTGSVGKTSTKDALYAALKDSLFIRKSEKSLNSDIGIPLTVLGCETGWSNPLKWIKNILAGLALVLLPSHYPKWLIIEVGTDHPGDIKKITKWLHPDIVIITSLPDVPAHVENFKNAKEVIQEKLFLASALHKDGILILNGDDKNVSAVQKKFPDTYVLLYGMNESNDVVASDVAIKYDTIGKPIGMQFCVKEKGSSMPVSFDGRLGKQQVYPIVAAFAVARALAAGPMVVAKSLDSENGSPGRMRILNGYNDSVIIDDTYNSSPTALRAALTTLKKIKTKGRKIAIIGDMLELGILTKKAHIQAGVQIASIVDVLVVVGSHVETLLQAAEKAGLSKNNMHSFPRGASAKAGTFVRKMLRPKDIVLAKGSQNGIRIERAVRELLADPLEAKKLLVRQDDQWHAKV